MCVNVDVFMMILFVFKMLYMFKCEMFVCMMCLMFCVFFVMFSLAFLVMTYVFFEASTFYVIKDLLNVFVFGVEMLFEILLMIIIVFVVDCNVVVIVN